jgi:hypothetical protein
MHYYMTQSIGLINTGIGEHRYLNTVKKAKRDADPKYVWDAKCRHLRRSMLMTDFSDRSMWMAEFSFP